LIAGKRKAAHDSRQGQANKMMKFPKNKFSPAAVRDTVKVSKYLFPMSR